MQFPASHSSEPHRPEGDPRPGRRRGFGRAVSRAAFGIMACMVVGAGLAVGAGFLWFTQQVPTEEITVRQEADGIVVLTGGASRIADAVELLAAGHGKRLLITGVHPTTSERELARVLPRRQHLLKCCVDLDHSAVNTVGNAAETRRWAVDRGFRSLIVVTSAYHMPRSMAELSRQLPDRQLIAFPVVTEKLRREPWWSSPPIAKLLISEFLKYMVAQVRMRLEPAPDKTDVARARIGSGS
ncbi:MAG TPA: YdcF family protein [Xanthobacteraceae bacterium]|nr:YdcF family protein [Xanthobacteraceae bacterium]